jgi:hypothetical protein
MQQRTAVVPLLNGYHIAIPTASHRHRTNTDRSVRAALNTRAIAADG